MNYTLIKTLGHGAKRLNDDVRQQVVAYVLTQKTDDETFVNRGGRADLYYTMFGWMLCHALGIKTDDEKRRRYLESIDVASLDALHRQVYTMTRLLDELQKYGIVIAAIRNWRKRHCIEDFFKSYSGHSVTRTLNTTAADMVVRRKTMSAAEKMEGLMYIRDMQDETGGFRMTETAEIPDLLSTAVALFTLKIMGAKPDCDAHDFIEVHYNDDGSFAPNIIDTQGDVEYVFYGLLALGSANS